MNIVNEVRRYKLESCIAMNLQLINFLYVPVNLGRYKKCLKNRQIKIVQNQEENFIITPL
ncbi:hypothetical protein O997_04410 [Anaplasma phagocytophilum str. MRK]|nr:hypothetical protein O997_04410 [Anaplasma phagocytophilum str. MRK]KDB57347.1 hypothetical protein P030_05595 [Anaplasma phagocytophilum str. CRT35]